MKRICTLIGLSMLIAAGPSATTNQPASQQASPPAEQNDTLPFIDNSKVLITRVGGSARGFTTQPAVFLLVSAKPGRTVSARPTIYWYLTGETESDVDLVITEPNQIKPFHRVPISGKTEKGMHATSLADAPQDLKIGTLYKVTITVHDNPDDPSVDPFSIGFIERIEPPASLRQDSGQNSPANYAQAGLWYDALDSLCQAIERDPKNPHLRNQRLSLLRQEHVFLTFSPPQRYLSIPGVADARARAAQRETLLLDEIAQQDRGEIRLTVDKH